MIAMPCPQCGHQLRIPDHFAGQRGQCKYCAVKFTVPDQSVAASGDVPAPVQSSALADLSRSEAPVAAEMSRPPPPVDTTPPPLSVLSWGAVFFLPPLGLLFGLLAPRGHPQRPAQIALSLVMGVVAVVVFGSAIAADGRLQSGVAAKASGAISEPPAVAALVPVQTAQAAPQPVSLTAHAMYHVAVSTPFYQQFADSAPAGSLSPNDAFRYQRMHDAGGVRRHEVRMSDGFTTYAVWINDADIAAQTLIPVVRPPASPSPTNAQAASAAPTPKQLLSMVPNYGHWQLAPTEYDGGNITPLDLDDGLPIAFYQGATRGSPQSLIDFYSERLERDGWSRDHTLVGNAGNIVGRKEGYAFHMRFLNEGGDTQLFIAAGYYE